MSRILGEPDEPVGLAGRRGHRIDELAAITARPTRQLELGTQRGQRGAQFVARIGDEPALPFEGLAFLGERVTLPVEQFVERRGERGDLVAGPRHGQVGAIVVPRQAGALPTHPLDRT